VKKQHKQQPAWANWVKFLLLAVWGIWLSAVFLNLIRRPIWSPAIQSYSMPNEPSGFQHIWSLNDVFSGTGGLGSIVLNVTEEEVLFYGDFHPNEPIGSLQRLALLTGEITGVISVSSRTEGIASKDNFVYVSVPGGKIDSESLGDAAQVVAYDIASGRQVWSQPIRGARGIASMSVYENIATVVGETATVNRYQHLNATTGSVMYSTDNEYPVLYSGDIWYVIRSSPIYHLAAIQSRANTLLWEQQGINPHFSPTLSNGVIVGRTGEGIGRAYGVDSGTGALLWQSAEGVYSNVSVSNGIAYFLTEKAQLVAVDTRIGQTVASLQLEPETPQERLTQQRGYNVAANGNVVVIYLEDSRQLFAFRFLPGG
jgi:hypothetical protein